MDVIPVFSIYDTKLKVYSNPLIDSIESLEKYLGYLVTEANTIDYKYATDFIVYHIADFNILTGDLIPLPTKLVINTLSAYGVPENA